MPADCVVSVPMSWVWSSDISINDFSAVLYHRLTSDTTRLLPYDVTLVDLPDLIQCAFVVLEHILIVPFEHLNLFCRQLIRSIVT